MFFVNSILRKILLFVLLNCFGTSAFPRVNTSVGEIRGFSIITNFRGDYYTTHRFLGIPYAKPPTGDNRFEKPEPYGAFSTMYEAIDYGPACPQPDQLGQGSTEEDCLFLNIFVPDRTPHDPAGHAVMIFVHGGAFIAGAGSEYPGDTLAAVGNVIVVTINYRLGVFGFLDMDDPRAPGNAGLWDQRLAFQWVKTNIKAFGGNDNLITIFGESAGSISVLLHALYPSNYGLFQKVIGESGAPSTPMMNSQNNIATARKLAEYLNCDTYSKDETLMCLKQKNSSTIISAIEGLMKVDPNTTFSLAFAPTLDDDFHRHSATDLVIRGKKENLEEINFFRSLDLILGINSKEGAMFFITSYTPEFDLESLMVSRQEMETEHLPWAMISAGVYTTQHDVVSQLVSFEYTDWADPDDPKRLRQQMVRLNGDVWFNVPGYEYIMLHSNGSGANSFLYSFAANITRHASRMPSWVSGANHADELLSVFGYQNGIMGLVELAPPDWELTLSRDIMTAWGNFAQSGNPNSPSSDKVWPLFNPQSQQHFELNQSNSTGQFLYAREMEFWRGKLRAVLDALHRTPERVTGGAVSGIWSSSVFALTAVCYMVCTG